MKYIEKHPMIMIMVGILGISASAIFVRFSAAPSAVTAAWRLLWTVLLMTPVAVTKKQVRQEMRGLDKRTLLLSCVSGLFLAVHFAVWFESLKHTSVASSTTIVPGRVPHLLLAPSSLHRLGTAPGIFLSCLA